MSRVGDEHFRASGVASALVIGADNHQSGEFAMSARTRVQREFAEPGELCQRLLQVVIEHQRRLASLGRLQRMQVGKRLQGGNLLVDDGIVFHRARPERIETVVHTEVVVAEVGVMAHHRELVALGQGCIVLPSQCLGQFGCAMRGVALRQRIAFSSCFRKLENQVSV